MPNPFELATRLLYRNPHLGQMGVDNPETITLIFPSGVRYRAKPLAIPISGFENFGDVITQSSAAKVIAVQVAEVPDEPPRNTLITGYADRYFVETSELSDDENEWKLDLQSEI